MRKGSHGVSSKDISKRNIATTWLEKYWLEKHHVVLDCYHKTITCLSEEGKQGRILGIPRVVVVREIPSIQLKKSSRQRCQMVATHMEEETKDKVASIEDHPVLRNFEMFLEKF
jgi:hypothetical protein